MKNNYLYRLITVLTLTVSLFGTAQADHCKGSHEYFPGCPGVVGDTFTIDALIIDRPGEQLTILGTGFSNSTSVTHAGNSLTSTSSNGGTELSVPFKTVFSNAVPYKVVLI